MTTEQTRFPISGRPGCDRPAWRHSGLARALRIAVLTVTAVCLVSGCRLLVGTAAVAVGAVGLVGYGVYKTGEAAVNGVGSVVSGVAKESSSVIFIKGEFKANCDGAVEDVWRASERSLKANGFQSVSGTRDALSGHLKAATWNNEEITVKLAALGQGQTEFRVRIGVTGDLKKSETLYHLITTELSREREAQGQGSL